MDIIPFENPRIHFQGLSIYIDQMAIEILGKMPDGICPFTSVTHLALFHHSATDKTLVGDVHIIFRSQGEDQNFGIMTMAKLSAKGGIEYSEANIFAIVVQYLFDWTNKYVNEINLLDNKGGKFIVPVYPYSAAHFEQAFPD
jgi:hypothetical protein